MRLEDHTGSFHLCKHGNRIPGRAGAAAQRAVSAARGRGTVLPSGARNPQPGQLRVVIKKRKLFKLLLEIKS